MTTLSEYLEGEHESIRRRVEELRSRVKGIATLFRVARKDGREDWPYSWTITDKTSYFPEKGISVSTQAMCCSAVQQLLEANETDHLLELSESDFLKARLDAVKQILQRELDGYVRVGSPAWKSKTYGDEDLFTAAWLLELYSQSLSVRAPLAWSTEVRNKIVGAISRAVLESGRANVDRCVLAREENEAGPHALPLLRAVRGLIIIDKTDELRKSWGEGAKPSEVLREAGDWFERNLHRQMSFYHFGDFRFDGAELIFCLAGALETGTLKASDPILSKVLELVRNAQERSVYWRPYRPMLSRRQGEVLLPLSIEVAGALLKTLKRAEKFPAYRDTLEKYLNWLLSQMVGENEGQEVGWHSENAYETSRIHLWDTALIMQFFLDYVSTLQTYAKSQLLRAANFTVHRYPTIQVSIGDMVPFDEGGSNQTSLEIIAQEYTRNDPQTGRPPSYSLLLYGPPGVSKTTMAEGIARGRSWDLVYLSPSDFITRGEAGIEEQAKTIFEALISLKECVIVFDEIDRMILDRDSKAYGRQGDMFQFMTPGMLTKLNKLRKQERSIFVIATNFAERIDRAIKRPGRIDRAILCLPYDLRARIHELRNRIDHEFGRSTSDNRKPSAAWSADLSPDLEAAARKMPLYVFEELERAVRNSKPDGDIQSIDQFRKMTLAKLKASDLPAAQISLTSYNRRLGPTAFPQKPFLEFATLLLIMGESVPDQTYKGSLLKLKSEWQSDRESFATGWSTIAEKAKAYGLESWLL